MTFPIDQFPIVPGYDVSDLGVFLKTIDGKLFPVTSLPVWVTAVSDNALNLQYFRRKKLRGVVMPIDALQSRQTVVRFMFAHNIAANSTPYEFELIRAYLIASMEIARRQS